MSASMRESSAVADMPPNYVMGWFDTPSEGVSQHPQNMTEGRVATPLRSQLLDAVRSAMKGETDHQRVPLDRIANNLMIIPMRHANGWHRDGWSPQRAVLLSMHPRTDPETDRAAGHLSQSDALSATCPHRISPGCHHPHPDDEQHRANAHREHGVRTGRRQSRCAGRHGLAEAGTT